MELLEKGFFFLEIQTYLQYFDLFPQQCLGFGQVLLVYAFYCHFPVMFLGNIRFTFAYIFLILQHVYMYSCMYILQYVDKLHVCAKTQMKQ